MSWWAQAPFYSHFQLWVHELLNSPCRTGNWNNKLLERKWNFNTGTRFVILANDLAPLCCLFMHFWPNRKMFSNIRTHKCTQTGAHKGGFMEASGDTLWTGFGRFTDMCGLKLAQLENAFPLCVHPSQYIHSSPAVSFISSSDLSWLSGPPASTQHTARSPHTNCKAS